MIKRLQRLWHRRKAITSNVVTILLIVLTITFSAIIYFVVIPLLDEDKVLSIVSYQVKDTDDDNLADLIYIHFQNNESNTVAFSELTVKRNGETIVWLLQDEYIIEPSKNITVICVAENHSDELGYADWVEISFHYRHKVYTLYLKISAKFNNYNFIYEEDFEDFSYDNWSLTLFQAHYPFTSYNNLSDWQIGDDVGGYKFWQSTSNNCHFVINQNSSYIFADANLSINFRTADDDATGFIFRYNNSGEYPNFYVVWFTNGHPSPRNGPHVEEMDDFNWNTSNDQILPGKITVHYVEGDSNGFIWNKIDEYDWIRTDLIWYTWRVVMEGSQIGIFIDNDSSPIISFDDDRISSGYIGLVSFGNMEAHYDNIFAWI